MDEAIEGADQSAWLTIAEAARVSGWNPERLRSLARRGSIVTRRGNRGLEILVAGGRPRSLDGRPLPDPRAPAGAAADDPDAVADDFTKPGHVVPLRAKDGGVLRAMVQSVDSELTETGAFVTDPYNMLAAQGVSNSGTINYLNKFGQSAKSYKHFDPVGEM